MTAPSTISVRFWRSRADAAPRQRHAPGGTYGARSMSVRKLFWDDPALTETEAVVTGVENDVITLDRTVAFAFSGGQESDRGTIAGHAILKAVKGSPRDPLELYYTLPPGHGLTPGSPVTVCIDGEARRRLMRLHFAAELVLELVNRHYDHPEKTGAHISPDKARLDFAWQGNISTAFPMLHERLSALVAADLPIESSFEDESTEVRYWSIEGFARVRCGGTHPASTGAVGRIRLRRENPGSGRERIVILLDD